MIDAYAGMNSYDGDNSPFGTTTSAPSTATTMELNRDESTSCVTVDFDEYRNSLYFATDDEEVSCGVEHLLCALF